MKFPRRGRLQPVVHVVVVTWIIHLMYSVYKNVGVHIVMHSVHKNVGVHGFAYSAVHG